MRDMKEKLSAATEESAEYIPVRARKKIFKAAAAVTVAAAFAVGACVFVPKFFEESAPNVVDEGFVTVSAPVPEDGSTPDMHTALENIAYMNAAFKAQESWYSEMHGTTDASIMEQSVSTFKQYSDGVLIVADITSSAMVKAARQFCYTGDEVMWRLGSTYDASTYEEMLSAEWKSGEPYAHMYLKDFIAENGLPATEFSVYIINEETLLSADEVIKNQDGTYSQTYYLDPAGDKAPAHYANQMVFSGGLTALPEFTSICITYTFDDKWQVLESVVEESYKATMGISVNCSSSFTTHYEYGTERAKSPAYEEYFKQYVGGEVSGPGESVPTAVGCLGEAFGSVLSGPVVFDLSLTVNGTPLEGAVYLDIGEMTLDSIALRADLGILQLWLDEGEAYLQYGGIRGKLALEEVSGALPLSEGGLDSLLAGLGEGEFSYDETSASLSTELSLGSISLPVQFSFLLDEEGHASLGNVSSELEYNGIALSLALCYGDEAPRALPESEKANYPELLPHIKTLMALFQAEALHAEIGYEGEIGGERVGVTGALDISLADGTLAGDVTLALRGAERPLSFAYADGYVYLELDGIKVKANAEEAISLLGQYIELPATETEGLTFDLDKLFNSLLSGELSSLVTVNEKEGVLGIAVKGNELLRLLGIDLGTFEVGDISLHVSEGEVRVEALGANVVLSEGETPRFDGSEYIDILPYAKTLLALFQAEALHAEIGYEGEIGGERVGVTGALDISLADGTLAGDVTLALRGAERPLSFAYADGYVYLELDGIKVKANAEEAISLLGQYIELPATETEGLTFDLDKLFNSLLSGELSSLVTVNEKEGVLGIAVKGNELLRLLGIDLGTFEVGDISLHVSEGEVRVEALGANVVLSEGETPRLDGSEYIDILPYAKTLLALFQAEALHAEIGYEGEIGGERIGVTGALDISLADGTLAGDVTLALRGAERPLSFAYADGYVYLELDGIKVKANAEEAISLLGQYIELPATETEGLTFDLDKLFNSLLSGELSSLVTVNEKEGVLGIAVKGNELLRLLGIDLGTFEVGDISLHVSEGEVRVEALGANVVLSEGETPRFDGSEYIDILPYAKTLINIFSSHFFRAEIDVEVGSLAVSGTVSFELDPVAFRAQLLLSAGGAPKLVTVEYAENDLFLTIDGVRLKADADELLKLLSSSLSLDREEDEEAVDYLKNFLSLDFSKVVHELSEEDGALYALVNGNEIMRALGIRELTGYIEVQVDEDSISLSCAAYRVALTLSAGDPFYIDRTDHIDVGPMLEKLFDMAEAKAFSFDGSLSLEAGGVQLSVNILRGTLSWENGFSAVVEGEIALGGGWQRFYLSANSSSIRIALGDLGISLAYDEFSDLGELASRLMEELAPAAERLNITLPDLSSVTGLLENFQAISGGLDLSSVDLGQLLGGLTLKKVPGSLFGVEIGALSLTLTEERSDIASVGIGYSGEGFTLDAALTIDEYRGSISMPRVPYLGVEEIEELSGYLTSAARLLGEECIKAQLTFDGITLDIWLDNRETSESGGAGVYVSVSRFAGQEGYAPLELWASAEEFKSILASAGALLGVELPVMGDSLDQDIAARLQVIGESLFTTLRSELGDLLGGSGSVSKELISDFSMNEDGVSLTLGGGALGLGSDLSLFLNKPAEGTAVLAGGIATGGTQIGFSLTGDTMPALPEQSAENALVGKYEVTGIGALLSSLAKTATHKATEEEFVGGTAESADDILLNRTFFIDGSIEVDAALDLGLEIPIKDYEIALQALSVSIHEDGEISLNVRLQYDDLKFVVDLIHGSTLDLTFKGDMIYMRRVSGGETLYRAMPLSVFGETIMEQLVFMFNMSDTVANMLSDISPEENGSEEAGDLGAQAGNILSGYEYLEESGKWVLTFNGGALTGNVLGDIEVTLGTDENGCISSLGVIAGMEKSLFKVDLSAALTLKNAGENFANVGEYTDLSAELSEGMGAAIEENNENGWTSHLEAAKSTVSFVVDGETVETQDVFVSGDKVLSELSYPDLEEREGYTASGWTQNGLTYTAKYVPNVYFLHFESDRPVEGWSQENGKWTFTLEYAYGTQGFELPFAKDLEQYIAYFTDEAGNRYRSAEDLLTVLSDKTLTAVWEEREYTVTYTDGDTVLGSESLHYGDALTFPQAPEKEGYRFVGWDTAESTVTGDMTIKALYEPLSFTVTIVSSLPYEGFVEAENCYLYTCEYTYGSSAIQLDDLSDVSGYWFGGFYTRPDGKGNQVNAVEGILADTTYYVYWQDNTVRVRLYSDFELEGAQKDEEGYFIEKTFNDTYALSDAPAIEGYRQLGWWVESDGGWKPVDDVLEFYGQDDVRIWAVWMQEIEIGISDFSVNVTDILVSKVVTYNIHGTVEGGKIVGAHGSQIFPSEPTKEVNYLVYGNGKQDVLSGGEAEAIEEGAFGKSKMTCGNFGSTMNTAPYGGAKVTHIFTYLDADGTTQSVSTTDEATVSLESYTIVYRDEDGAEVMRMEVRGSYGAQLTLADLGLPEVPEKMGNEGSWDQEGEYVIDSGDRQYAASSGGGLRPDLVLSHTIEVRPVYTAKLYPVTLTAQDDVQIDGWTGDSYTLELHFGDVILFEQSGNSLGSHTVGTENEVLLPKLTSGAYWCAIEETEQGILIRAMKDPDHVALYDAFGGESEVSFDTVYTPDAPSPQDGFTFLGWWKQTDGAWEKVDSLAYTGGGNQFALYALWVKLGNVSANSDNKTLTVTADAPQFKSAHEGLSASGTIKVSYRVKYASGLFGWGSTETEGTLTIVGQEASQTFDGKIKEYSLTGKTLIYTVDGETYEL